MPWMQHIPSGETHMIVASPFDDATKGYSMRLLCCPANVTPEGKLASGVYDSVMVMESEYKPIPSSADKPTS